MLIEDVVNNVFILKVGGVFAIHKMCDSVENVLLKHCDRNYGKKSVKTLIQGNMIYLLHHTMKWA